MSCLECHLLHHLQYHQTVQPALPSAFSDTLDHVTAQIVERMTHIAALVASRCGLEISPTAMVINIQSAASGHANAFVTEDISTALLCLLCADALEHAAWTKGDQYLHPLRHDLNAFQMGSWDVMLIALTLALAVVALALCLAYYVVRFSIRLCRRLPIAEHTKIL